ncbi:aquaporin [Candidatus Dependentiae bacterium Noda2021]|nr:aquaporin [Candidatus Dependentiae bacterium Noda2021]
MMNLKPGIVEGLGTFFLALIVGLTGGNALAVGLVVMGLVYAGAYISGAHYNGALSLAATIRGLLDKRELISYWVWQLVGAVLGFMVVHHLVGVDFVLPVNPELNWYGAAAVELLFTFAFAWVWLTILSSSPYEGNQIFGLVIGLTLTAIVFLGGTYNPILALGSIIVGLLKGSLATKALGGYIGAFIVAPLVGAALAAYVYRYLNEDDDVEMVFVEEEEAH